jgi:hypothetical protein
MMPCSVGSKGQEEPGGSARKVDMADELQNPKTAVVKAKLTTAVFIQSCAGVRCFVATTA